MPKDDEAKQTLNEQIAALQPEDLFRTLATIRKNAKPLEPLWGFLLYKKAITSIIGDPGVCKTTMGYGLSTSLCLGQSFLSLSPEEPIIALYMDFESSDSLVVSRANLILSDVIDVPNFYIYNIVDYYLPHIASIAIKFCNEKGVNLIIVDNQSMAFSTRDENDNAEAIKQMKFIRSFTNACNASTIVFHHTSKANLSGTRKGSGAFARARLADICVNLDLPNEEQYPDVVRFTVAKNRMVDEKVLWYFKKEEGKFIFCEPPLGAVGVQTNTQVYKTQKMILEFMKQGVKYQYNELLSLASNNGLDSSALQYALKKLIQQGRITKPGHGSYLKHEILKY